MSKDEETLGHYQDQAADHADEPAGLVYALLAISEAVTVHAHMMETVANDLNIYGLKGIAEATMAVASAAREG